ncbi:nitroreductase family protein [bacterium]|nr:nitroreductase family protein [bacterium]
MKDGVNFFDVIKNRKTVRKFADYIPTDDEIKEIIDSARLAPSAVNAQNWKFIAILNSDIKQKMADAVLEKYDEIASKLETQEEKDGVNRFRGHSTFFTHAPLLIAIIETKYPAFLDNILENADYSAEEIALMRPDSQLLSMGGAVENMALTAHALGLGSCWMVAPVIAESAFKKILNLADDDKVVSLLTIGKPADVTSIRSPKKNLEDVMQIIK